MEKTVKLISFKVIIEPYNPFLSFFSLITNGNGEHLTLHIQSDKNNIYDRYIKYLEKIKTEQLFSKVDKLIGNPALTIIINRLKGYSRDGTTLKFGKEKIPFQNLVDDIRLFNKTLETQLIELYNFKKNHILPFEYELEIK